MKCEQKKKNEDGILQIVYIIGNAKGRVVERRFDLKFEPCAGRADLLGGVHRTLLLLAYVIVKRGNRVVEHGVPSIGHLVDVGVTRRCFKDLFMSSVESEGAPKEEKENRVKEGRVRKERRQNGYTNKST